MAAWVVPAGNVCLYADPGFQRHRGKGIARIGRKRPGPDTIRSESAELPDSFIIEIPIRLRGRGRAPQPCTHGVPRFLRCSAIVFEGSPVQPQVIAIKRNSTPPRTRRINAPECGAMIRDVIEETLLIQVWTYRPSVDSPTADPALESCPVETLSYIRPLANRNQTAGAVIQLLTARQHGHPVVALLRANLDERLLEVELLLVDRPRPPFPK